ncbi:aminopeptidase PepB [Aestuariibacter halophilus]|uniref:Aminopeptidase PepB n=1 Tax=Fluctibacter halophilus TaxID=226011 RepID=A0ABS8G9A4_9ALTE|nr:aminopeptidase PepB [Aestuariibacter halophilus]MCC2617159.1 aminopeptidase PepB [Aestuariibacter halophilus]
MTYLAVEISTQPVPAPWNAQARLSFNGDVACVHVDPALSEPLQHRQIQQAARQLESMNPAQIGLRGNWHIEQQWTFAQAFSTPKKPDAIQWCDDDNQATLQARFEALAFTRSLVNETPEDLSPETLAQRAADWLMGLAPNQVSVKSWVGEALLEAGWVGIYNVGRGSDRPPVLLEVDVNPTGDPNAPVAAALVGKGITFDSGGYSIKSSEGMLDMKCDMGGAATVTGGLGLAMLQGLNKRVKLFLCCAENLISGHAYKLGDVLTYKNGTTVEIVNTDAEGRLVLADGLMAATESGAPLIINAATLTGAAVMAVGNQYNALFTMDEGLRETFLAYAREENELLWPLPLEPWHKEMCPSPFADTANSRPQKGGGAGGASNAAGFLSRFVREDGRGWVHLDLAAAYNGNANGQQPPGATGQGIRTIARALLAG